MAGFKKVLLASVAMSFCASSAYANNSNFNGFYAGLRGGASQTNAVMSNDTLMTGSAFDNTNFDAPDNQNIDISSQANVYSNSGAGNVFIGYGKLLGCSHFYLGGEIFGGYSEDTSAVLKEQGSLFSDSNGSSAGPTGLINLNSTTKAHFNKWEYGIDFRPGYVFDHNTMAYGRVGLASTEAQLNTTTIFTSSYDSEGSSVPPGSPLVSSLEFSKNRYLTGLRLGAGIQHIISPHFSVTADYIYTYYGKIHTSAGTPADSYVMTGSGSFTNISPAQGLLTSSSSATLSTQTLMLGLSYRFA